jgi:hypothetical protein
MNDKLTIEQLEKYKNTYDCFDGIPSNEFDAICDELIDYKQLEEKLGCSLKTVVEHINESYKMLCQHIEITDASLKNCHNLYEVSKVATDIALSKEQKGICEKRFAWLKKDRSE